MYPVWIPEDEPGNRFVALLVIAAVIMFVSLLAILGVIIG